METSKDLEKYLSNGVSKIVKGIVKASISNPKASLFMMKYAICSKKAKEKRETAESNGKHIPPFLIASITDKCNLHCKGCYARANHSCIDLCNENESQGLLTAENWGDIFNQAEELGIEFILLAGGEPFVRKDVLQMAGEHQNVIFPVFTNGTMIKDSYIDILDKYRNILPVISIEGNEVTTDTRRGQGVYKKIEETMKILKKKGILFGASITVTKANVGEVLSEEFVSQLKNDGVKAGVYVEYVPMDEKSAELAPDDDTRKEISSRLSDLRNIEEDVIFIAFPGDEKTSGGCLAAGRGFFHINAHGGAEPCPFSPFSDTNIIDTSLMEALESPLFIKLQTNGNLYKEHIGGCVLAAQQKQIQAILQEN